MANFHAVFTVGSSIAKLLQNSYPAELKAAFPCQFRLVSSTEIATEDTNTLDQMVSIFLHRITLNENFRGATRLQDSPGKQPVLSLDLHYLITYWGTSAEAEQTILTWTMQQLQTTPILDGSVLSPVAACDVTETVQLVPADLSLDDVLKIWDGLGPKYRLSLAYLARVVRIDRAVDGGGPVVATRFIFQQNGEPS